jgi:hypothetical protein
MCFIFDDTSKPIEPIHFTPEEMKGKERFDRRLSKLAGWGVFLLNVVVWGGIIWAIIAANS